MKAAAEDEDPLREEAVDWLVRLREARGDEAEVREGLEAWLAASEANRAAWRSVERVWRLAGALPEAPAAPPRRAAATRPSRGRRVLAIGLAAIAACLALYVLPVMKLRLQADHLTTVAELKAVTLEDGSVVHLDAGAAIAVRYGAARREVALLAGRAFFQVVPGRDRPFVVVADDLAVTVTGTAFDVDTGERGVNVAVQSGVVEVRREGGAPFVETLSRGQQMRVARSGGTAARSETDPDAVASWRDRRLVVDNAPLAEVVEEIGRHYSGAIVMRDRSLLSRRITGVFDLRHPVEALNAAMRTQYASVTEITPYLLVVSGADRQKSSNRS